MVRIRKTLAIAGAILLIVPAIIAGPDPTEDVFNFFADLVVEFTDIGAEGTTPNPALPRQELVRIEQVLEGHIVWTTINITRPPPPPPSELNIIGLVQCYYEILGVRITIPPHIDRIYVECSALDRVFVTPQDQPAPSGPGDLVPTGWTKEVVTPAGTPVQVQEFSYWRETPDDLGVPRMTEYHCWVGPVLPTTEVSPDSGKSYNFQAAWNPDRYPYEDGIRLQVRIFEQEIERPKLFSL